MAKIESIITKPGSFRRLIRNLRTAEKQPEPKVCNWCGYKVKNPCTCAEHRAQCEFS